MTGFPPGFIWGVAASAYQIEGAAEEAGRHPSIWDTFSDNPAAIAGGGTGRVACDHVHRWREDVALMAELGVDAYRLSVSWSRVVDASGTPNRLGLDFYDRLVDTLAGSGIAPVVNLFHWDLPQVLQDRGGWQNRDTVYRFADYAGIVAARLGDRVHGWAAINEMFEHFVLGHGRRPGRPLRRLVHVDYATQRRTPKASFGWLRDQIRASRTGTARRR